MSERDKEYFVKENVLFCNAIFRKDDTADSIPWDDCEKVTKKFFIEIDSIDCGNMCGVKGATTIRSKSSNDFVINVPFKELVKLKYGIEI